MHPICHLTGGISWRVGNDRIETDLAGIGADGLGEMDIDNVAFCVIITTAKSARSGIGIRRSCYVDRRRVGSGSWSSIFSILTSTTDLTPNHRWSIISYCPRQSHAVGALTYPQGGHHA